jgi:hypothetical protein
VSDDLVYVYGVVRAEPAPKVSIAGVTGAAVGTVPANGIAALSSPVKSATVRARRRDLLAHSDVLTSALDAGPVVPLQFGTVFESSDAVVSDLLEARRDELEQLLSEIDGRVELRVSAFYDEAAILAEIIRERPRIAKLRDATRSGPEAATYAARIDLGELVASELRTRGERDAAAILDRVRPLAVAVDVDDEPIEHQVLRASFLVDRARVETFDEAMDEIAGQQAGRIRFKYVGPLAPHSFVSLGGR